MTEEEPEVWAAPAIHGCRLPDAERINARIIDAYGALKDEHYSRRTHYFGGRFENLYLDLDRIPILRAVLAHAERSARQVLSYSHPLRCGFWLNAQGPGQATSEHTHAEDDELLSGVYYVKVPPESGDLILEHGCICTRVRPAAGLFLFFSPSLSHRVEANKSGDLRLSLAFNFGPASEEAG